MLVGDFFNRWWDYLQWNYSEICDLSTFKGWAIINCPLIKPPHLIASMYVTYPEVWRRGSRNKINSQEARRLPERGGKRAGEQPAKDVAEALGIAAGVQSGWLGAAAAPAPLDPAQRQVSADPRVPRRRHPNLELSFSTWTHKKKKTRKKCTESTHVCNMCMHATTHAHTPLTGRTQMFQW